MENRFRSFCIISLAIMVVSTTTWGYVVKNGDTLSGIAYKNISKNVYGQNGSINKILALNPQIKNPNFIKPGVVINFGEKDKPKPLEVFTERAVATDSQASYQNHVVPAARTAGAILTLTPFYNMTNISAKDNTSGSESIIASQYYVGANASYIQQWSNDFHTAINLKLASIAFEKPASSTKSLKDSSKFLSSLGIETNHSIAHKTHLKLGFNYGKELFVRAATTEKIAIDAINVPSVSSKLSYDLKDLSPFTLGVSLSYAAKMPSKADAYNIKLGHEYGASLYLKQHTGKSQNSNIQTELGFTHRSQDTSITSQTETNIMLGVRFPFSAGSGL